MRRNDIILSPLVICVEVPTNANALEPYLTDGNGDYNNCRLGVTLFARTEELT